MFSKMSNRRTNGIRRYYTVKMPPRQKLPFLFEIGPRSVKLADIPQWQRRTARISCKFPARNIIFMFCMKAVCPNLNRGERFL